MFNKKQTTKQKVQANKMKTQPLERVRVNVCRPLWRSLASICLNFMSSKFNQEENLSGKKEKKKFYLQINMLQDQWLTATLCHFKLSSHKVEN